MPTMGMRIKLTGTLTAPSDDRRFVDSVRDRAAGFLQAWAQSGQPDLPLVELLRDVNDALGRMYLLGKLDAEQAAEKSAAGQTVEALPVLPKVGDGG